MKTLIQKIQVDEQQSFACRTYCTPIFETNWHQHEECELIIINEGHGTVMIGEYVGGYKEGDVYFIASNLPHWFKKQHPAIIGSATVIHFKKSSFGEPFLQLPEIKKIQQFLHKQQGIQLQQALKTVVTNAISAIDKAKGFQRLQLLLQCLQSMSTSAKYSIISHDFSAEISGINPAIEEIIDFTFKHYLETVTLPQIAAVANMSIPTFCRFFKKNIKKTYFDFLQDLRISHACKILSSSNKPVMDICYESGYNSWAHFSKQFKRVKKMTPTQYRNQFEKTA
jgi:AraC-like DNA-binding protein